MQIFGKFTAAVLVCMLGVLTAAQAESSGVFQSFDGKAGSVESWTGKGKWLVVMIWAHDCPICNVEVEGYAQFHEEHKDKDASVLGISIDGSANKAGAEEFIRRHDVPFSNLIGEPQAAMRWYMAQTGLRFHGTPTVMIYGPDGRLRAAEAGAVPLEIIEKYINDNS